ncbi:histidine--tRNA ligase [Spiroplasma turonicum]|uniref:Histidine--tRNA ligase n=1 Tax=Spiroplasma turonicum TaxID=216946 RepID=A0A0K1P5N4_9MOLU|nr:histidine--tRNA ligase [Spiroplasma turonicum]AKU79618.1 histidyl-tRNA synthetase [Spiroplasma turonicum]ALX70640.1 histidyl-tRNA synthetase [Spiroplasma turonicum]
MTQKPRGTEDIYNEKAKQYFALEMIIRNIADNFNYSEIITPTFEHSELFKNNVGETTDIVTKEMYNFLDKKNRELTLKPEGTVPTVRAVIENKLYIAENLPLKLFYFSSMYRYERPQKGRMRQFNQFGVEVFGPNSPELDSELISFCYMILNSIGLNGYSLHINYIVTGEERLKYIEDLKKYLSKKKLCEDCNIRINKNPLRVIDCKIDRNQFEDIIDMKDYISDFDKNFYNSFKRNLKNIGIDYIEDKKLVRGLDYYTGIVFEIDDENGVAIIGGGRYNTLFEKMSNISLPASGFGIGIERLLLSLDKQNITLYEEYELDAFIIALTDKAKAFSNILLLMLRNNNLKVDFEYMNKSLKSGFKSSEKYNPKNIIIVGDNEIAEQTVIVKNQKSKKEEKIKIEKIVEYLKKE